MNRNLKILWFFEPKNNQLNTLKSVLTDIPTELSHLCGRYSIPHPGGWEERGGELTWNKYSPYGGGDSKTYRPPPPPQAAIVNIIA